MSAKGHWSVNISALAEKYKTRVDVVVRKIVLDLFVRVVQRSPVDTGRFKGAWIVGTNAIPKAGAGHLDKTTSGLGSMTQIVLNGVSRFPVDQPFWLANNLPYSVRLEYGWSKQAPGGMVRLSLREVSIILKKAVAEARAGGVA